MMKKIFITLALCCMISTQALAFVYQVKIYTQEELLEMKDPEVSKAYIQTMIEKKAIEGFHSKAGFSPTEYNNYRELLDLVVRLHQEMAKRGLEVPPVSEWLE